MPNEALPNKREVMLALLAETSVFVHLDPRGPSVRVPPWFKNQPQLVLQVGLNMAVQIPDLDVGEQGISCTLSFSRRPFFCSIPWSAVFGLVGDNGPGLVWPDDVPAEIASQVQAQTQKAQQVKKPTTKEPPRGRLRAVGSESPAEDTSGASQPATPEPARDAPVPLLAQVPAPAAVEDDAPLHPSGGGNAAETLHEAPRPQPVQKPAQSQRPGSKRELPPYLRVVK